MYLNDLVKYWFRGKKHKFIWHGKGESSFRFRNDPTTKLISWGFRLVSKTLIHTLCQYLQQLMVACQAWKHMVQGIYSCCRQHPCLTHSSSQRLPGSLGTCGKFTWLFRLHIYLSLFYICEKSLTCRDALFPRKFSCKLIGWIYNVLNNYQVMWGGGGAWSAC